MYQPADVADVADVPRALAALLRFDTLSAEADHQ
jgi:hypothetical protein